MLLGDPPVAAESAELEATRLDCTKPEVPPDSTPNRQAPLATAGLRATVEPLSPERYRIQFTVGRETYESLRQAQELLRREVPNGDPGAIFDRALKLLLAEVARRKLAATSRPRPAGVTAAGSRHVPAHLKRAVWLRDGGRCAFVARSGRRCRERAFLEFHHIEPYAIGGEATVSNLSLRCRAHNAHEAERLFGLFVPGVRRGVPGGVPGEGGGYRAPRQLAPGRVAVSRPLDERRDPAEPVFAEQRQRMAQLEPLGGTAGAAG